MNSYGDGTSAQRMAMKTRFEHVKRTGLYFSLSLIVAASLAACNLPERSRSLGDPNVAAKTLALQVCSNCHGVQGVSVSPNFPNLAAQSQPYLVEQLKSFKSHGRSDPAGFEYMWGISARLTDDQINGLAAYFSSQSPPSGKSGNQTSSKETSFKEGQKIFEQGIAANNTPACSGCHGAHGEGIQQFPRLAGQHSDYIVKQLMVFQRTDERPEGVMMKGIAHELTPENMRNVAAYLEAMPSTQ
ncbi:Cytochrome c553 [Collimonas sp. OK307]|uniref:c-type cytochrome n=1 Tax=Collimonas sp. OK307 TaxID=1801620 RepID=UPI0008E5D508|nr:cytochrome c4 [Collimonas sp. OK307]SFI36148.1 Cytochrome c553 [Collimonas sp. OK307]